jgi:hypothetical protein
MPAWHVLAWLHTPLVSLQTAPSGNWELDEQTPVAGSQVPAAWHCPAAHTTGFEPVHTPLWQVSVCVHRLPSLQGVPLATDDQALVELLGAQTSHALPGFTVPDA